jgi:hypothetical protein
LSYLRTPAQETGQHVPEDLAKVQLSEFYPMAHFVVGIRNSASQWVVWLDLYGDWPRRYPLYSLTSRSMPIAVRSPVMLATRSGRQP